jgi:hypothetical protein
MCSYVIHTTAPRDKVLFACHDSFVGPGQFFKRRVFGLFGKFKQIQVPGADLAFADALGISNEFAVWVSDQNGERVVTLGSASQFSRGTWQNNMKNNARMKDQLRNRVRWIKRNLRSQGFTASVSRS